MSFLEDEIKKGRQVYIVYPLIEESTKGDAATNPAKDLKDLKVAQCCAKQSKLVAGCHD